MTDIIYINASDVATAIGISRFKTKEELISSYLTPKKYENELYENSREVMPEIFNKIGDNESKEKFEKSSKEEQIQITKDTLEKLSKTAVSKENNTEKEQEIKKLKETLGEEIFKKIDKNLETCVNTNTGKNTETKNLDKYETNNNIKIEQRNDKMYYLIFEYDNFTIKVGGKIDGYNTDTNTLIETKTRRYKFLGFPEYEKVQCEIYMMMKNTNKCILIENFNSSSKEHYYESSEELKEIIKIELENYGKLYLTTKQ